MRWLTLLALTGCQWDALVREPDPPPPCYLSVYWYRVEGGVRVDSTWAGTAEVPCPAST